MEGELRPDLAPVLRYIREYWPKLARSHPRQEGTLIGLPRPYLVPADGPMFQEMYYWDSYFMALGLPGTNEEEFILHMAANMAHLFRRFGLIPNGNRYYFLSRSQPPFSTALFWLAYDLKQRRGDTDADEYLQSMMRLAEREHERVWMGTAQPHHRMVFKGLSRYFDINYLDALASCESGWDHSTRCSDRWLEHLPVDLNSILYVRELDLARASDVLGKPRRAETWRARAAQRAESIMALMWDEEAGFFFDYDWVHQERNPHQSVAGFFPLWAGFVSAEQAERVVRDWLPRFEHVGGLVTTQEERAGRQWAYPNGWAPLHWIVTAGLDRYGHADDARRVREKWVQNCVKVFAVTGAMWEKYNVIEIAKLPELGLYGSMAGFGWSNAVFKDFVQKLGYRVE